MPIENETIYTIGGSISGVSVLSLLRARTASDFADWFRPGGEYLLRVADGMGFRTGDLSGFIDEAETAMRADRTGADVAPTVNRLVAADLTRTPIVSRVRFIPRKSYCNLENN